MNIKNWPAKIYSWFKEDIYKASLVLVLIFLSVFTIYFIHPKVEGDSITYVKSIEVLKTGVSPVDFVPNRIVSTYLGLRLIMLGDLFLGSITWSWLLLNMILYIIMGMFFYLLLLKIIENRRTAFIGTILLATNYAGLIFSFHFLMDIGGWAFYVASLYYSYLYLETKEKKWLWISSAFVGIGGLYKEYAFLAYVVILGLIIFVGQRNWKEVVKNIFLTGLISFFPIILLNVYSFYTYHYTYLSWYSAQSAYAYQNKLIEYIKSFGSLYTFGWFLFLGGSFIFFRRIKEIFRDPKLFFIGLTVLSSLVVFIWPVVTRVLFITIPGIVMVSSLFLKKIDRWWYWILPLLFLYVVSSFLMDSFILNFVNLPF